MANKDTTTAGSIAEHDILLSISEEAINRQFKLLYDKPISVANNQPPPPGLKLKSGAETVPSKYYINHELQIFNQYTDPDTEQLSYDHVTGIFAHVKCPHISLKEEEVNTARISFTFERSEGAKAPDSEYRYWVGAGPAAKVKSRSINGWTMSWKVRIGDKKFGDVQKDVVDPAQSSSSPVVAPPATIEALKGIDPKEFTVAAIFCIFEDALLANSFDIKDENGKVPAQNFTDMMLSVSHYFTDVQKATARGAPTADNPFVLGYSLSQTVPDLKSVNPDAIPDDTPKYLIPKGYQMTTTPGYVYDSGRQVDSQFTKGTLNFCLLTFRDPGDDGRAPAKIDMRQNANSGKLEKSLFDLTKTKEHDGIMAFAEDLIFGKLLGPTFTSTYALDVNKLTKDIDADLKKISTITTSEGLKPGSPPYYERKADFNFKGTKKHTFYDDRCETKGCALTRVSWNSDLQTNPNIEAKDAVRKIYITVHNEIKIDSSYVDTGLKDDNYESHFDIAMKYVWEISAGKGGVLDITKNDSKSVLPERGSDGKIKWNGGTRGDKYGAYLTTNNDKSQAWEIAKGILTQGNSMMTSLMVAGIQAAFTSSLANSVSNTLAENTTKSVDSLRNKVIMPAGNVFNFAGVDIDSQGNMFAHISFALGAEGVGQDKGKGGPIG